MHMLKSNNPTSLEQYENISDTLDFNILKQKLSNYCKSELAKQLCINLYPFDLLADVNKALDITGEAINLIQNNITIPSHLNTDVIDNIHLINLDNILTASQLKYFSDFAYSITQIKNILKVDQYPEINALVSSLPNLEHLKILIDSSIDRNSEILDTASPILGPLRRDLIRLKSELHSKMEIELSKLEPQGIIQEPLITERNHRSVLLIKSEYKYAAQGIVHDVSDSGATVFIEPLNVVELGNSVIELQLSIDREETNILRKLSLSISVLKTTLQHSIDTYVDIDFAFAKGYMAIDFGSCRPVFTTSSIKSKFSMRGIRHPLLNDKAVPLNLELDQSTNVLLITGPNSGGKTLTIKTIGLLTLMAKTGLHVPAERFQLPFIKNLHADIGDSQNMDQSLSSFTGQMTKIKNMIDNSTSESIILLDELGSNTDPEEGSAIAKSLLNYFNDNKIMVFATTHLSEICNFIHIKEGMINASLKFDPVNLTPTYELQIGIPGKSLGLTIAQNTGLPASILEDAYSFLSDEYREVHGMLQDLNSKMSEIENLKSSIQTNKEESDILKNELEKSLSSVDEMKISLINKTKAEIEEKSLELLLEIETQFKEEHTITLDQYSQHKKEINEVINMVNSPRWAPIEIPTRYSSKDIAVNQVIKINGFNTRGTILSTPDKYDVIQIAVGAIKTKIHINQIIQIVDSTITTNTPNVIQTSKPRPIAEIDLHGYRSHEALELLDQIIHDNFQSHVKQLRIIHGDGTGTLRRTVRNFLSKHALVERFEPRPTYSSDAVTIAFL